MGCSFIFCDCFFYSMVGFGGGSSYIALMVLSGIAYPFIPITALTCNIIVAGGNLIHFYRAGELQLKKLLPFIVLSVPMAFFAGRLVISQNLFCLLLGGSLFLVALRLGLTWTVPKPVLVSTTKVWAAGIPLGALLGFLSGIVGIGGGIFLSPILLLLKWTTPRQAAAAASSFILLNSVAGWFGQLQKGVLFPDHFWALALAVFLGGQFGSIFSMRRLAPRALVRLLALLIFYVSIKLILKGL